MRRFRRKCIDLCLVPCKKNLLSESLKSTLSGSWECTAIAKHLANYPPKKICERATQEASMRDKSIRKMDIPQDYFPTAHHKTSIDQWWMLSFLTISVFHRFPIQFLPLNSLRVAASPSRDGCVHCQTSTGSGRSSHEGDLDPQRDLGALRSLTISQSNCFQKNQRVFAFES